MSPVDVIAHLRQWLEEHIDLGYLSRIPTWVYISLPTAYVYYRYMTWYFDTFKKLGIDGPKPWPIIGTGRELFTLGLAQHDMNMRKYGTIVGTFVGRKPSMIIFDVEILKHIFVKEFSTFPNRYVLPLDEYPLRKALPSLKDEQWKRVRNILTPTFSSGKLRKMNSHFTKSANTLLTNLKVKAESGETFDFKDYCSAFTMDAIASVAFGLQIDSHNDPNNLFVTVGKKAFTFSFTSAFMLVMFFCPFLIRPLNRLGVSILPRNVTKFFVNVVQQAFDDRRSDGETRDTDFIQLMINAHMDHEDSTSDEKKVSQPSDLSSKQMGLTHEEVLAQGLMFFIAGFEATANTLALLAYSLATNPQCQEKLLREIDQVLNDQETVDYDVVQKMPYLDMCLSETLRLYPPNVRTDRIAADDITINGLFIPKGMQVTVSIYALHMDPQVWPEPTKFIPERFLPEQKEARNPYSYLPFGAGPRNCIGMRLALTELKIAMITILKELKFVQAPETQVPLKLDKVMMKSVDGVKLRVERRHHN